MSTQRFHWAMISTGGGMWVTRGVYTENEITKRGFFESTVLGGPFQNLSDGQAFLQALEKILPTRSNWIEQE